MAEKSADESGVLDYLRGAGLLAPGPAVLESMSGGVSSDVWLVRQEGRVPFVVKRSVAKLRVKADWRADPKRLRYEFLFLQRAAAIEPRSVPRLLCGNPDAPLIAMEFFGHGFANWKAQLLQGNISTDDARRAGQIIGRIHSATTQNSEVEALFLSMRFFIQLRIEAYFMSAAKHQPAQVAEILRAEANRLTHHRECLVHGDFSPKNLLMGEGRVVVLDCETACYGDPAFDVAFLLNHLLLKALYHKHRQRMTPVIPALRSAAEGFVDAYSHERAESADAIVSRALRLLPMLFLARVDGKSPVEYLDDEKREFLRCFARHWIEASLETARDVVAAWFDALECF